MFHGLVKLYQLGYRPDTILDIGACHGSWTYQCQQIYPNAQYYLFEPIDYPHLNPLKSMTNIKVFQALLDHTEQDVDWYEKQNTGDSMFREKTIFFKDCHPIKKRTTTLSTLIDSYLPSMRNVFIKIDCQGAEIPILKGAGDILQKTDFILLEIPLFGQYNENVPNFLEHIQYMDTIGFIPFDILEVHSVKNFSIQIDILFISKKHPFNNVVQTALMN
jgi:FkbM family methyltransferase